VYKNLPENLDMTGSYRNNSAYLIVSDKKR
jgi:hypothetical protein